MLKFCPLSKKSALASEAHSLQTGCLLEKPIEEEVKGIIVNGRGPRCGTSNVSGAAAVQHG